MLEAPSGTNEEIISVEYLQNVISKLFWVNGFLLEEMTDNFTCFLSKNAVPW